VLLSSLPTHRHDTPDTCQVEMDSYDQPPQDSFAGDASVRSPWPMAHPQKQAALEAKFFEDGATIHFDKIAPLSRWATTLSGLSMLERTQFVGGHVIKLAHVVQRKLTQPEIDALSEAAAQNYRRLGWSMPLAIGLTSAAVYHGWETFRFPFYTPKATWFHPQSFPSKRQAYLKGRNATFAWHLLRSFAYYPLMKISTTLFITSIATASLRANILTDQRLREVKDALSNFDRKQVRERMNLPEPGSQRQQQQQQQMGQSDQERRDDTYRSVGLPPPSNGDIEAANQRRRPFQPARTAPSSATDSPNQETPVDWGTGDSQQTDSNQFQSQQATSIPTPARRPSWGGAKPPQEQPDQPQQTDTWGDSDLFDDDASPVSSSARQVERKQTGSQTRAQGASSWDRIRQQANSDASPFARGDRSKQDTAWGNIRQDSAQTTRDRPGQPNKESYSYSEAEAIKDYAKSQAQKEFDEMLEAERKGTSGATGWRK
jgi:hypothetical protein